MTTPLSIALEICEKERVYQLDRNCYVAAGSAQTIASAIAALSAQPEQPQVSKEVFGYFHELLDREGKGNGIWLGCADRSVTERSYIEGEVGKEIIALYRYDAPAQADKSKEQAK